VIDFRAKGFPALPSPIDPRDVAGLGWSLFDGRFLLPVMALRASAVDHNIRVMADYCAERGVSLAPHGKTTMSPAIFRRQLDAGAWAMTLATAWQARVAAANGVPRILLANEVVDAGSIDWLASTLDDGPEVYCWVDSVAGIELLDARLGGRSRRLPVLIELGIAGGRAGVRDLDSAVSLAHRVAESATLRLAGVTFFEGIAEGATDADRLAVVTGLISLTRRVALAIEDVVASRGGTEILLSGGGSRYIDVVVDGLSAPLATRLPRRVVLRSGCTVTHDHGLYDLTSPFGSHGLPGWPRLRPALEVWAPVVSMPEPGRAIVGAGKRDLSFDMGVPPVLAVRTTSGGLRHVRDGDLTVTRLNDQHAYVAVKVVRSLAIGDLVALGVPHPCTGLDKWRWLPLLDDENLVIDAVELIF
jgi:D-serine deaminase-like pyridoxal phosphate-dependent protein